MKSVKETLEALDIAGKGIGLNINEAKTKALIQFRKQINSMDIIQAGYHTIIIVVHKFIYRDVCLAYGQK